MIDWYEKLFRKRTPTLINLLKNKENPESFNNAIVRILRDRGVDGIDGN